MKIIRYIYTSSQFCLFYYLQWYKLHCSKQNIKMYKASTWTFEQAPESWERDGTASVLVQEFLSKPTQYHSVTK